MCGIAGIVRAAPVAPSDIAVRRMAAAIRHRGPDGYGTYRAAGVALVSTRLAVIDIPGGWQPLVGEDGSVLVYNGEVYNYLELGKDLRSRGCRLETQSDTEVVHRMLETEGLRALDRLNGQFALARWEPRRRRLTLARDRFGVRPLYYAELPDGGLWFGSEVKSLFASGAMEPRPSLRGIDDVFTLWSPRTPRTAFEGVRQLSPGGLLIWQDGAVVEERRWWRPGRLSGSDDGDGLDEVLRKSVALRLRADVQVGAYLSGGVDSSLITALASEVAGTRLRTFSVAFHDARYDERPHQEEVARALGTDHYVLEASAGDIAAAFREAVYACETPLVRTAPVPLWLLAREVRRQGLKVVLTGEGADELFWGYDLFKEVAARELNKQDPVEAAALVAGLYPELAGAARRGPAWSRFILDAGEPGDPFSSHRTRAAATGLVRRLYRDEILDAVAAPDTLADLHRTVPSGFEQWPAVERAAYLEITTLLGDHLLAAQGDRVAMAHGVEGRYPFLDPEVFERSCSLRPARKLNGLHDKIAVREAAARMLPSSIAERRKQPYRAPEVAPFVGQEWVRDQLSRAEIERVGIFDADRVERLVRRCTSGVAVGPRESMAFAGTLSTQVWFERFCGPGSLEYRTETEPPRVELTAQPA